MKSKDDNVVSDQPSLDKEFIERWITLAWEAYKAKSLDAAVNGRGENEALRCFQAVKPFLEVANRVRNGFIPESMNTEPRTVELQFEDSETGEFLTRIERVDEEAFHPNLPVDHPLNKKTAWVLDGHYEKERLATAVSK